MKQLSWLLACATLMVVQSNAQYNNEWINYSSTYYKIPVAESGVYRITKATLDAAGLGSQQMQHFQLWRNGAEVALHTSTPIGAPGANDYLEFYGERNDGKPDRALYTDPNDQLNSGISLFTDTAIYFLTINTASANKRMNVVANNAAASALPPASFVMKRVRHDYFFNDGRVKKYVNPGEVLDIGEYLYASDYSRGEMMSSHEIYPDQNGSDFSLRQAVFSNLLPYTGAGAPSVLARFALAGASNRSRTIRLSLDNTIFYERPYTAFEARLDSVITISPTTLQNTNTTVVVRNITNRPEDNLDRIVIGFIELDYAKVPNAGNAAEFSFFRAAGSAEALIEVSNFNHGGVAPELINADGNVRMQGIIMPDGKLRFLLPANSARTDYIIVSASGRKNALITATRSFVNYAQAANQGNYLIITNKVLLGGTNNPVDAYRQYRNSAAGGGYTSIVVPVDELVDQFAFGIKMHPLGVKNFVRFARRTFAATPQHVFLIGRGVTYDEARSFEGHPRLEQLMLVPTFGYPASDNMLASDDLTTNGLQLGVGRLGAINTGEVKRYLDKVKEYEAAQQNPSVMQADKAWMKNVVHVVGANDAGIESLLRSYMDNYRAIISDTLFGARVTSFNKFNTGTATVIESKLLQSLFQQGFSLLTYYGHSSATALDYNLDDPQQYNNPGKYPAFLLNGCNAGNFYTFDTTRLSSVNTISEKYVLAENRGAIALIASTHFGVINGLNVYSTGFYRSLSTTGYNRPISRNIRDAISFQNTLWGVTNFQARMHTQQQTLHGDPAIKINAFPRPDYSVEPQNIAISPNTLSIAETSFKTKIHYYNIGMAVKDSILLEVKRQYPVSTQYPNGFTESVLRRMVKAPLAIDSIELTLNILPQRDRGLNKLIVELDGTSRVTEISEANNTTSREFVILEDELRPVYPYNLSIVNKQGIKLIASTSNPFSATLNYRFEIDTTEFFNSSLKVTRNVSTRGGIVEFDPGLTFTDSTVYYWRLALVPPTGDIQRWNTSSFVYIANNSFGFNQSHFFQHLKSMQERLTLDSASRTWQFNTRLNNIFVNHSIYPISGREDSDFSVWLNNSIISASFCKGHSLGFMVFDGVTFKPWRNYPGGLYGSTMNDCRGPLDRNRQYNFEWDDRDTTSRRQMRDFMDAIPNGSYVIVRKVLDAPYEQETFAPKLKADQQVYGVGNTLYDRLKNAGFASIDSFNRPRTFVFIYRKNDASFDPIIRMSEGLTDRIQMNVDLPTPDTLGYITSPLYGPAKAWKEVIWRGRQVETDNSDHVQVEVWGVQGNGQQTLLRTLGLNEQNASLTGVSASAYPFIQLRMRNADSIHATPYQLRYWRVTADAAPEGALAPNLLLQAPDTLGVGQPLEFKIAFKNISEAAFDSLKIAAFITDASNVTRPVAMPRKKPLVSSDTLTVSVTVPTQDLAGINTLYIAVNPDNDQPEQYFFNNFLYKTFLVQNDLLNPVLDVTFDGVRILNRDIVSAKPHIQIKLKDENSFLALNDTSALSIKLLFPGEATPRIYRWGTDTLRFTPGNAAGDNTATIDFYPALTEDTENAEYELTVSGKDRLGNPAGNSDYRVSFQVFNKPMISNLLNYPNPFSTSTAFVFTLTGSEVPQEFKIQIMTLTGKIVREITRQELGPLHVGTNITEYKWDGTDTYGGKLANGVYLYRVVTSLNGNKMDKFRLNDGYRQGELDVTDQFFNKTGYGKMVILR